MTLHNAPVPGPLVTATALILAALVLYAVLFTLAALHACRCDRAEQDGYQQGYRQAYAEQDILVDDLREEIDHLEQRMAELSRQQRRAA